MIDREKRGKEEANRLIVHTHACNNLSILNSLAVSGR